MHIPGFAVLTRTRWRKGLLWAAAAFLAYVLFGFFALPPLIKWQMLKRLPDITKRRAAVRQVKFNPLALSLTIRGLALTEPDGRPFASWEELYVNFQSSSLFRWAWTFDEIRLVRPFGEIILFKDGRLNFANMAESPPAKPAPPPKAQKASMPRVNIFHLEITNGFVALEDRTRRSPFRTEYQPINLKLTGFTTQPNSDTPYSFYAESDAGRSVSWAGDLTVVPPRSHGRLEVTGVRLSRYQPYLEGFTRALLTNGVADLALSYRFEAGTNGTDLLVTNGTLHVEQVQIRDPDTGETVAGFHGFDIQRAELDLRQRTLHVGSVRTSEPAVLARFKSNGHVNLLDLLTPPAPATNAPPAANAAPAPAPAEAGPPWVVTVDEFAIEKAAVAFEDLTLRAPFKTTLQPIDFTLKEFSTRPNADAHYSFRMATEVSETLAGSGTVSINPLRSAGEINLAAAQVAKYMPYVEALFRGKLTAGQLAVRVPYQIALATNGPQARVSDLAVNLTGLELKGPDSGEVVLRLSELGLEGITASLQERQARLNRVKLNGASVLARRLKDGAFNLQALLPDPPAHPAPAASTPPAPAAPSGSANPWTVTVDEISLSDCALQFHDHQPAKPAAFLIDRLALHLKGVSTDAHAPLSAALSLRFNQTGVIAAKGTTRLDPLAADFQVGLTNLDLRAAQPYLEPFIRLGIVRGALSTYGRARYQTSDPATPQISFAGGVSVTNFLCTDQVAFKEFARWDDLAVTGVALDLKPDRFKIDEVKWVAPKATLILGADHQPNLALILVPAPAGPTNASPAPPKAAASPGPAAQPIPLQIGTVALERAAFAFEDDSIEPHANLGVQELSGTLKGLSSAMNTTAEVNLTGRVDGQSTLGIAGRVNPLAADPFVDLVVSNSNTQLTPLTPYFEKYAGHPLNKGRLSTRLHYRVEHKDLKAENKIDIDHLTLGPRNNSPEATKVPVKLAVALLKDRNGLIDLDLPLHGRTDDPQFSVGPVIIKVLLNTLTKAAASPFKLLGALVGGGEELSFVDFAPGTTNLVPGDVDKLAKLAKALGQRPALNLEIEGAIDPVADRQALAKDKLHDQLKTRRLRELAAKSKTAQSAETFELAPEDFDRLLRATFAEKFGTNIAAILRTNQLAMAATNAPAGSNNPRAGQGPKPPLYQRVYRQVYEQVWQPALALVGLGKVPRKSPAERHLPKADRLALNQATPEFMETLIAGQIAVTDDDFRRLMSARARGVQAWLQEHGQVASERLLLVAPKPVNAAYRGESRANLSVD